MALLDRVSAKIGMPPPRLHVVKNPEPRSTDKNERPETFEDFIGQETVRHNLATTVNYALKKNITPDHILLTGPPGLGKTSLAKAVATKLGWRYIEIPGTALDNIKAVAAQFARIGEFEDGPCVVFVDEIHILCKKGMTLLLSALQEGWFQVSGSKPFYLAPFVLIAATTNPGKLDRPLKDRFGVQETLDFYELDEMVKIINRYANRVGVELGEGAAEVIANVGRETPRIATALLRRVIAVCEVGESDITAQNALEALAIIGVDQNGLTKPDIKLITALCGNSRPIGLIALASLLNTDNDTVTELEPYLQRKGFIERRGQGRVATKKGYRAVGLIPPAWTP
jgi:Holliday junction DNA helicase RuvB